MCSSQNKVGRDEGGAADEALVRLAGDGDIPEQSAHVGPLAELRARGLWVTLDPRADSIEVALTALSLERLLQMTKVIVDQAYVCDLIGPRFGEFCCCCC